MNMNSENGLKAQHHIEEDFHDAKTQKEHEARQAFFNGPINFGVSKLIESVGDYDGKRVLEFGCGSDGLAIYLGSRGAVADGFDISGECVRLGNERIKDYGIEDRVTLKKMSAEEMDYPPETFDIVIGNAVLHHCDLQMALNGIHRVLKKGGSGYFLEPLGHNIFLKIYRALTPGERTATEKPFEFSDFRFFEDTFSEFEHEEMFLFSLICYFWKIIIPNKKLFTWTFEKLIRLDTNLLKKMPFLRKHCWVVIFKFKK